MLEAKIAHRTLFNGETRTYHALTKDEADSQSLDYVYWKSLPVDRSSIESVPHLVLSDDGWVIPIHHIAHTKSGIVLRSAFGVFLRPYKKSCKASMTVLSDPKVRAEDYLGSPRTPKSLLNGTVVQLAAHGLDVGEIVSVLCTSPKSRRAENIKRFYKSEECTRMVREEVRKILENVGLTEEKVVRMLIDAHEVAKSKTDAANMLRATENLIDIYGLKDKLKETQTQTIELGSEVEDLERLESVKERLKLSQKTEKEER